jgi:hypothetical protein
MLATWMRDHNTTSWTTGMKFIQLKKNLIDHSPNGCSPYKTVFGIDTPLGLRSTTIPVEEWSRLKTAKDLLTALGLDQLSAEFKDDDEDDDDDENDIFIPSQYEMQSSIPPPPPPPPSTVPPATMVPRNRTRANDMPNQSAAQTALQAASEAAEQASQSAFQSASQSAEQASSQSVAQSTAQAADQAANTLLGIRGQVSKNQKKQADRMLKTSKKYLPPVSIGDYVTLPIPDVDRGLCEAPNLICRVVDIDYATNLYELCCEAGVLEQMYARNAFDRVETELHLEMKLHVKIGLRSAVRELSIGGGQGMVKCDCTGACANKRCGCKKNNLLCNSKCHGGNSSCKNK